MYDYEDMLDDEAANDEEDDVQQEIDSIEEKITEAGMPQLKLDYTLKTMRERVDHVNKITAQIPAEKLTNRYLEILGDYIMNALTKEERKSKIYLTDNRMITINRRETSYEGLVEKFENGEDGIYNLISDEGKNAFLTPRVSITEQDLQDIPELRELRDAIERIEAQAKAATGKKKYMLKKHAIDLRRDQYIIKDCYKMPMHVAPTTRGGGQIDLYENRWVDENFEPHSDGLITLFDPKHVSAILCNYTSLKEYTAERFQSDFYYLMEAFDDVMREALTTQPLLYDLTKMKIAGKSNAEIQEQLDKIYGVRYTVEHISQLWRNKIPKLIAEQEKDNYLIWHFTFKEPERAVWKKCSKCGQNKLALNRFFSRNNTAKSGFYSQCKRCRNSKN